MWIKAQFNRSKLKIAKTKNGNYPRAAKRSKKTFNFFTTRARRSIQLSAPVAKSEPRGKILSISAPEVSRRPHRNIALINLSVSGCFKCSSCTIFVASKHSKPYPPGALLSKQFVYSAHALAEQIDAAAPAINDLSTLNSRKPLDQDEYQTRFNALADQRARILADHKLIADQINDRQTRRRTHEHYQQQLAKLEDDYNVQYSPFRWRTLLDHAEINKAETIKYIFRDATFAILTAY